MKFLVDELPYYGKFCPFASKEKCYLSIPLKECPRYECELLKEASFEKEN